MACTVLYLPVPLVSGKQGSYNSGPVDGIPKGHIGRLLAGIMSCLERTVRLERTVSFQVMHAQHLLITSFPRSPQSFNRRDPTHD